MFRALRRAKQALPQRECEAILQRGETCVLALAGDDGYPYAVPVNYCYAEGKIYIHCAKEGHKIDAIRRDPKASLAVIDCAKVLPEEYSTHYRSVIAFGRMRILEDEGEMRRALSLFAAHLAPEESEEARLREIDRWFPSVCVLEFTPEHSSGKQSLSFLESIHRPNTLSPLRTPRSLTSE